MLHPSAQCNCSNQSLNPKGSLVNTYAVPVYTAYLVTTVGLVVWLARTLYRNGAVSIFPLPSGISGTTANRRRKCSMTRGARR